MITVGNLIEELSNFPEQSVVRIKDADTGWLLLLNKIGLELQDEDVYLSGDYCNNTMKEEWSDR